jgi:2,5-diamino-6-(ribosylamino)-4(3H)-pyrimidinone 5'-phosphate reductase
VRVTYQDQRFFHIRIQIERLKIRKVLQLIFKFDFNLTLMKKLPRIVIHNSISLDGSLTGFMPDMEQHYRIAGEYKPEIHLIGSNTIKAGIEMFGGEVPAEEPSDFYKPDRVKSLPIWVIVDSGGKLEGLLHTCRRFEFCRDVIVLISESTPESYLVHLRERNYDFISSGKEKVDIPEVMSILADRYGVKTVLTDTGMVLGNLLINLNLVSEISLLIHPVIFGESSYGMFGNVDKQLSLKLLKKEELSNGLLWVVYEISGTVEKSVIPE